MKAGKTYQLPVSSLVIINTGNEPASYEAEVTYHVDQEEMWPPREWFTFSPIDFDLEPGKSQEVTVEINLPVRAVPGDYFAFLEGHPIDRGVMTSSGVASIGIAAATKFNFTVAPSNIFQGIYYKIASFFAKTTPWSYIVIAVIFASILVTLFRRRFNFNISVGKK